MKTAYGMVCETSNKKCVVAIQNKFCKLKKKKKGKKILMKLNSVWTNMLVNTEHAAFKGKVFLYLI